MPQLVSIPESHSHWMQPNELLHGQHDDCICLGKAVMVSWPCYVFGLSLRHHQLFDHLNIRQHPSTTSPRTNRRRPPEGPRDGREVAARLLERLEGDRRPDNAGALSSRARRELSESSRMFEHVGVGRIGHPLFYDPASISWLQPPYGWSILKCNNVIVTC